MEETGRREQLYTNRELSWLKFEERVLEETVDITNPLLERARFLSICSSNLDEFFMVRVASLKEMVRSGSEIPDIAGFTPSEQLLMISDAVADIVNKQYLIYNREIRKELKKNKVKIITPDKLTKKQAEKVKNIFEKKIYPVLTPIVVDKRMPFPLVKSMALYFCVELAWKFEEEPVLGLLQVPARQGRLILLEEKEGKYTYILTEDIIRMFLGRMFSNFEILNQGVFRVTRDADLSLADDEAGDLLKSIESKLKLRQWGEADRLEIEKSTPPDIVLKLRRELFLEEHEVVYADGPVDLTFLFELYKKTDIGALKIHGHKSVWPHSVIKGQSMFDQIKEHDIMLFHPYESFEPVIDFIKEAAMDKDVLAIKQTLYRVSGDSPVVHALAEAAQNGKQVTVLVELKARFDEENNIGWARVLEAAGCNVIYGPPMLKTHCKISLVVRSEGDEIVRYTHLSTGNYNDTTAKTYSDIGLFTVNSDIGEDATEVFNLLSGYSKHENWKKFAVAPVNLRETFLSLIKRECDNAKEGKPSGIFAKVNSLCDKEIIDALYEASANGVKIDLVVRGICCLKTGIPGISDNITVRSIVGIFLEHSRIYKFENGGKTEYYLSSADWMPRNLDRRIEILFPVEDKKLRKELNQNLIKMLKDNEKARILHADGSYYVETDNSKNKFCYQEDFLEEIKDQNKNFC